MPNSALRFALLGYPVEHSLSPALFSYFAQQAHRPISYRLLSREIPKEAGEATLRFTLQWAFETLHLDALNITSPYKLRVGALCIPSPEHPARLATGAVNLVWQHSGVLYGTNTDIVGAEYLIERTNVRAYQLPALVLGAGGATEPVLQALCNQKIERICCNRTNEKAQKMADEYSASFLAYEDLPNFREPIVLFSVLPHNVPLPPVRPEIIQAAVDVAYVTSPLRELARSQGIPYVSGYGWLFAQAVANYRIISGDATTPLPYCDLVQG